MSKEEIWFSGFSLLVQNAPSLVLILFALIPVLALVLSIYVVHVIGRKGKK